MKKPKTKRENFFLSTTNSFYVVFLLPIILTNLSCSKMGKQYFKVLGEESLLKDCKINISIDNNIKELKTILFCENQYQVKFSENDSFYTIYFSYKDTHLNKIQIENVFYGASDRISNIYITKTDDLVTVLFIGREAEIKTKQGFEAVLIPMEDYFKLNKIDNEETKNKEKKLFFDSY